MTRLPRLPLTLLALAALLAGAPPVLPADALPEGARARLGEARFGHPGVVSWVVPLPDGKRLLTMAADHRLRVWDAATAKQETEIAVAQPFGAVFAALAPDRKSVATVSSMDHVVHVWDLATGKEERQFAALPANQAFFHLAWSPDGKSLVSYHHDRVVRFWDAATGKEERQLPLPLTANPNSPTAGLLVRLMPDGKALAVVEDWSVRVLDPENGKELRWFGGHTAPITTVGFTPDGKLMATVAADRHARLWDVATGKTVARLPMPPGGGRILGFDGDGKLLAVGAADRTVRVFDVASAKEVGRIDHGLLVQTFSLSKDGKTLYLVGSGESIVRTYDVGTGKEQSPPAGHSGSVSTLAWSPDGKTLASAGAADRSIVLWDAAGGKVLRRLPELEVHATLLLHFAPDGKSLLSFGADRVLRTWDVAEGKELRSFVTSPLAFYSCTVSRDGKLAALSCHDQKLRVWDVDKGELLHRLDVKMPAGVANFNVLPLAFAGDGRTLLSFPSYERGLIRRWDAVNGKELAEVKGLPFAPGIQPWLSADGRSLIAVSGNTTTLAELASGKVRQSVAVATTVPPGGGRPILITPTGATLSPDSRTLAVASSDGTLRFWDTGWAKELATRKGLPANPRLLGFSPDGKTLATAGPETAVTLWDVPAPTAEGRLAAKDATADKLDELWKDLGGEDATRAWQAVLTLESAPKEVVPFVEKRLKPGAALDDKGIAKLIAGLDAEGFQEREDATEALIRAGKPAEEAVKKALDNKPSAEAKQRLEFVLSKMSGKLGPDLEEVRVVRGVEVLERVGTPEARKVLEEFAKGGAGKLSAEAHAAAERLKAKAP